MLLLLVVGSSCKTAPTEDDVPTPEDLETLDPLLAELIRETLDAVRADPTDPERWARLGAVYEANRLDVLAAAALDRALARTPDDPKLLYRRGILHRRLGNTDEAIVAMARVSELTTYSPAAWQRGFWLLDQGKLDEAELAFVDATAFNPDDVAGWAGLARVRLQRGEGEEAAALIESVLDRPNAPIYLQHLLGLAYRQMGLDDRAAWALRRGRDSLPTWPDPWTQELLPLRRGFRWSLSEARRAMNDGRTDLALPLLERLATLRPGDRELLATLGRAYLERERFDEAQATIDLLATAHPRDFRAQLDLAKLAEMRGEDALALGYVDRALELNPDYVSAHLARASLLRSMRGDDEAFTALDATLQLDPGNLEGWMLRGDWLAESGRWPAAADAYERAFEASAGEARVMLKLSRASIEADRLDRAAALLELAMTLDDRTARRAAELSRRVEQRRSSGSGS